MFGFSQTASLALAVFWFIIILAIVLAVYFLIWRIAQKLNVCLFKKLEDRKGNALYIQFLRKACSAGITIACVISLFNFDRIRQSLFGSAAILTAVIGFAGQDVTKDILSGLQISIYRPFDIGDRIELEDGTVGIVESITMRHVVITRIDTLRTIIPNSKLNNYSILNYSYADIQRSMLLKFPVAYHSDISRTKQVIADAVKASPFTIPGKAQPDGKKDYAPVYFIDLDSSALIMSVTIYYNSSTASEKVRDSVNTGVFEALAANGIEVPYAYTNVVLQKES